MLQVYEPLECHDVYFPVCTFLCNISGQQTGKAVIVCGVYLGIELRGNSTS